MYKTAGILKTISASTLFLQGAKVVVADLQVSNGESVAKEIGENASFVPTDVSATVDSFPTLSV